MSSGNNSSYITEEVSIPRSIRFWLLLIFEIPSLICSIFILYHFIIDKNLRNSLKNHSIIILNIIGLIFLLIDIPSYLNFVRIGKVWSSIPINCLIWWFINISFNNICCLITAWISIERHILIFHNSWLLTKTKRLFIHYCPLIIIIVYEIIYYTWVIFFLPCQNFYSYHLPVCGAVPCYLRHPILRLWESIVHGCIITIIIIIFSIGLVIRIILGKYNRHQRIQWKRHRKMTFQMFSICLLFIIFNLPITIMYIIHIIGISSFLTIQLDLYAFFLTYWLLFFLPFVCLNSLPNLKQKLRKIFPILSRYRTRIPTRICKVVPVLVLIPR